MAAHSSVTAAPQSQLVMLHRLHSQDCALPSATSHAGRCGAPALLCSSSQPGQPAMHADPAAFPATLPSAAPASVYGCPFVPPCASNWNVVHSAHASGRHPPTNTDRGCSQTCQPCCERSTQKRLVVEPVCESFMPPSISLNVRCEHHHCCPRNPCCTYASRDDRDHRCFASKTKCCSSQRYHGRCCLLSGKGRVLRFLCHVFLQAVNIATKRQTFLHHPAHVSSVAIALAPHVKHVLRPAAPGEIVAADKIWRSALRDIAAFRRCLFGFPRLLFSAYQWAQPFVSTTNDCTRLKNSVSNSVYSTSITALTLLC